MSPGGSDEGDASSEFEPQLPPNLPLPASTFNILTMGFSSSEPPDSYVEPASDSGTHNSDEMSVSRPQSHFSASQLREVASDADALRKEQARYNCQNDPSYARNVLDRIKTKREPHGWCVEADMKPTKSNGYIQVSYAGANKFAVLQEVLLWARGGTKAETEQCSHLCNNPLCTIPEHIHPESVQINNDRKGCPVWIDCHHCPQKIMVCRHDPYCIFFCEGFNDMADFVQRGVCRSVKDELRLRADQRAALRES